MAQPAADDAAPPPVDPDVWHVCAPSSSSCLPLPDVGSVVFYFLDGHAEQCPTSLTEPLPDRRIFLCTVAAIHLSADAGSNEPCATISLIPDWLRYFVKQLLQSDVDNRSGLTVRRVDAERVFPSLDFGDGESRTQPLLARDLQSRAWEFRHVCSGSPAHRHLLRTGWNAFLDAMKLVTGDSVVFVRRPDGELLVGVRRQSRYHGNPPRNGRGRVSAKEVAEVAEAARLATEGERFTVTYYPQQRAVKFVVPREEVLVSTSRFAAGTAVRLATELADDAGAGRRTNWGTGIVKAVSTRDWRKLEVEWDDDYMFPFYTAYRFVNPWQLQPAWLPLSQPPPKKHKISDEPSSSSTAMSTARLLFPGALPTPIPPRSSDHISDIIVNNPQNRSSPPKNSENSMLPTDLPEETKSIMLFGTKITPLASGASEQGNQAHEEGTVADETVNTQNGSPPNKAAAQ